MRLVIREYLSTLKESGELDALLPDLLTAMGIIPQSKAKVGTRQHGVDISAEGEDPEDAQDKLFLITAKAGNIDRGNWNSGSAQDVEPSLDEILNVYIQQRLDPKHEDLPKKIILCSTGIIEQNVLDNWKGYKKRHSIEGEIEFDYWGADELAILIEENILDEFLFPESAQKELRKTLTLIEDSDYDLSDYYSFLNSVFSDGKVSQDPTQKGDKSRAKAFRLINLSLNIVYKWTKDADNLMPAYLAAERALLVAFNWLRKTNLLNREECLNELSKLFNTYNEISNGLVLKLKDNLKAHAGLYQGNQNRIDYPITCFRVLGILATIGLFQLNIAAHNEDQSFRGEAVEIALDIINLINTNPGTKTPLYDDHVIDICLGALLLHQLGMDDFLGNWLNEQINRVFFAFRSGRYFPVSTDSYDDLLEREFSENVEEEKLYNLSTLIPILIHWIIVLDDKENYNLYQEYLTGNLRDTNFQVWIAEDDSEEVYYTERITNQTGMTFHSIEFEAPFKKGLTQLIRLKDRSISPDEFAGVKNGFPSITLMASRHHRNPIPAFFWFSLVKDSRVERCIAKTNQGERCSREAAEGKYCWQHL